MLRTLHSDVTTIAVLDFQKTLTQKRRRFGRRQSRVASQYPHENTKKGSVTKHVLVLILNQGFSQMKEL
jgi:hypothetical protein